MLWMYFVVAFSMQLLNQLLRLWNASLFSFARLVLVSQLLAGEEAVTPAECSLHRAFLLFDLLQTSCNLLPTSCGPAATTLQSCCLVDTGAGALDDCSWLLQSIGAAWITRKVRLQCKTLRWTSSWASQHNLSLAFEDSTQPFCSLWTLKIKIRVTFVFLPLPVNSFEQFTSFYITLHDMSCYGITHSQWFHTQENKFHIYPIRWSKLT